MKLNWNFHGGKGVQNKTPSVVRGGGAWIFCRTTQFDSLLMRIISIVSVQTCFLHPSDFQLQELPLSLGYSRKNPPPPPRRMANWKFSREGGLKALEILAGGGVWT